MSSERGAGETLSSQDTIKPSKPSIEERDLRQSESESAQSERTSPPKQKEQSHIPGDSSEVLPEAEQKLRPSRDDLADTRSAGTETATGDQPRQVIAVSASKGPAAFFNLARKFLVTDEMCDLSALEGAIVSAVDAAHLLERSQLATIVSVSTSYVTVEPKRKKQHAQQAEQDDETVQQQPQVQSLPTTGDSPSTPVATEPLSTQEKAPTSEGSRTAEESSSAAIPPAKAGGGRGSSGGRELRRARIVITVRRTESYKQWLEENPLQAIIAGGADDNVLRQPPSDRKQTE